MKKSNWAILVIAVAISAFLLWLWYALSFNTVDSPLDLALSIVWWCIVALACGLIYRAEKTRQERIRTVFLASDKFYNSEAGVVALGAGASPVESIEQTLAGLKYNFDMQDFPSKDDAKFDFVIRSKKFEAKKADDDHAAEGAQASQGQQVEVTAWEGEVATVAKPDDDPQKFSSRAELLHILEGAPLPTNAPTPTATPAVATA